MKATHVARLGAGMVLVAGMAGIGGSAAGATNISLGVPVPAGVKASADPACKKTPNASFCTQNARYVVAMTPSVARAKWLPGLTKWGMKTTSDTCSASNIAKTGFCVVRGVRTNTKVTVVFRAEYVKQYAPAAVKSQAAAIQKQANRDAAKAKKAADRRAILKASATKIANLKKVANTYNAANPKSVVTVTFRK